MRIATWNIERLKHKADSDKIYEKIYDAKADILVLTETDTRISPEYKYCYSTPLLAEIQPDYYGETENRVTIFSDYPCVRQYDTFDNRTAICVELDTPKGLLLVYGTIIGIFGNREKSFMPDLEKQMEDIRRLTAESQQICVLGDYNLTFCDNYYYTKAGRDVVNDTFKECGLKLVTRDRAECIDHIAISESFTAGSTITVDEWNYDKTLYDHKGIVADIR